MTEGPLSEGLTADGIVMNFAGLRALDLVSLSLGRHEIVGLIGPNGSGKTTLVNVLAGALKPNSGTIWIDGVDATGFAPRRIARAGLVRTFQTVRLFGTMTVFENVQLGALGAGVQRSKAAAIAHELISLFEIEGLSDVATDSLSYGQKRIVEILRSLATGCKYLLLDEPAAGLNEEESEHLLSRLTTIPEKFGCGLLIIDHDMNLIMRLCHRLHVLNQGRTIAEGTADEIRANPVVVEAYLGSQATAGTQIGAGGDQSTERS